jgi:hypothetical protein
MVSSSNLRNVLEYDYLSDQDGQSQSDLPATISTTKHQEALPYEHTYFLICDWADDHRDEHMRNRILEAYQNSMAGTTRSCAIPSINAATELRSSIESIIHQARSVGYNLVIIHYLGESDVREGRFVLMPYVEAVANILVTELLADITVEIKIIMFLGTVSRD